MLTQTKAPEIETLRRAAIRRFGWRATTPSKAALAQCKCQLQPIDTSMLMGVEANEELVNLRVS